MPSFSARCGGWWLMAEFKYVIQKWLKPEIERKRVSKETACYVTFLGTDYRGREYESRYKKDNTIYDTWESAHAELLRLAEAELNQAQLRLQQAQGLIGKIQWMQPPQEEP
jgi:hypothetical protein